MEQILHVMAKNFGEEPCPMRLMPKVLPELERVVIDGDEKGALSFLKKAPYDKITHSQQGKLKSHLDTGATL